MPENRYLQYLIDPSYNEDYGVSPPPSRMIFAGAAVGAALLFLRTPAAHAAVRRFAPRATGQTLLERKVLELYHARQALANIVQEKVQDGATANRLIQAHIKILNREGVDYLRRHGRSLTARVLGAKPVTVGDILDRRIPFEYRPFRLVVPPIGDDVSSIGFAEEIAPAAMEKMVRDLARELPEIRNVPIDPGLLINRRGEIIDLRGFNDFIRRLTDRLSDTNIPIVNWNIGQILRLDLIREIQERPKFSYIPKGSVQPFLGGPLQESALLLGRKLVSLRDPSKILAEGVYVAPFGTPLRAAAFIQEVSGKPAYRSWFHRLLDLGAQSERRWIETIASIFRRKHPLDLRRLSKNLLDGREVEGSARRVIKILESEPMPLPKKIWESDAMRRAIQEAYRDLFPEGRVALDTKDDLIRTLYLLISSGRTSRAYRRVLWHEWKSLSGFPDVYFRRLRFSRERLPQLPYVNLERVITTSQEESLRHLLQREIRTYIRQRLGKVPFDIMSDEAFESPALRRMVLLEELKSARSAAELTDMFQPGGARSDRMRTLLEQVTKEMAPWYAPSFDPRSPSKAMAELATGGLLMREFQRPPSFRDILAAMKGDPEAAERARGRAQAFFRQFFSGRHDPEHFTTATLFPYYSMLRLNDMFAMFGLGLSERSMGSAQQIFFNLLSRRYLAAIALFGYAGYLSWEVENLTGFSPKRAFFDMLAGANIAWASLMNATGVTDLTRRTAEVMPGSELVWELPVLSFFDPRWEAEELAEFLREGTAPVRRGRWWQYSGPVQGGPILYYWPSWYRRFTSDWEFTEILWGEREEAYRNWWLPTPRYPASPIRHFITEPYHLEEMWGRSRPYPITGPIPAFSNVPVIGPLLSATIGRLLKPPVSPYEEEMAAWAQGVPYELSGLGSQLSGAVPIVQVTPAGLVRLGLRTDSLDLSAVAGQDEQSAEAGASPAQGKPRAFGPAFLTAMDRLAGIHQSTLAEGEARTIPAGPSPSQAGMAAFDQALPAGEPAGTAGQGPLLLSALGRIAGIHQRILAEDQIRSVTIRNRRPLEFGLSQALPSASLPGGDALHFQLAESFSQTTDILGLYGFLLRSALGVAERPWEDIPRLATPERVTSLGRWHAELQIGGFPGELSEVGRRFLPAYRRYDPEVEINPIRNLMPSWMPGSNYFINFKEGDQYAKIPHGEYRLPGPGYERMHGIPPLEERLEAMFPDPNVRSVVQGLIEQGYISPYETYSAWERFKILADVAPWSEEYKYYEKLLTDNKELIPSTKYAQFQKIKKQVSQVKKRERFFPYRFRHADLEHHNVTVTRVINNNIFMVEGFDRPIRLAGVYVPIGESKAAQEATEVLSRYIYPGAQITIGIAQDPLRRTGSDQLESIRAVVVAGGMQLNRYLLEQGIASERPAEDPASIHVRFSPAEIAIGSAWERFAHLDTPIHTALLQVRSPLEMYERKEVFGKSWRPWWEPVSSILIPTLESLARHSPLVSAGYGYVYGRLATLMSRDKAFKHKAGLVGAGLLAGLSALRMLYETVTGETWIPARRRLERDVEMYFSALEYLKYRGIYEFARRRALEQEGFDVESLYQTARKQGSDVRRLRRELEELKKELTIEGPSIAEERLAEIHAQVQMMSQAPVEPEYKAMIRSINERLRALGELRREQPIGPWAQLAIQARERFESTIWGMNPYGHLEHIIRALPRKDRIYITEFMEAPEPERRRILQLAPIYVRRVLQARWGMKPEPLPDLAEFFSQYWLPPLDSGIWSPAKNLEDLKVKVVEALGLEFTEFGLWRQDVRRAEQNQAPLIPWNRPGAQSIDLERQLKAIMEGQGLENVWVRITPVERQGIHMMMNINRDPSEELRDFLLNNPYAVFGGR